jgi:small-conductance mechanosensitive channel
VNRQPGGDPAAAASPDLRRRQVLARRRLALIALMVLAVGTLVGAVLTGSYLLLALTLACDVMVAVYIAVLLQIKRRQAETRYLGTHGSDRVGAAAR